MNKEAVNGARSLYYGFFSKMFIFKEDVNRYDGIEEVLDILIANPMDANSAEALKEIKEFFELGGAQALIDEYDDIFHNPESMTVRDTASYYDEQIESGKKRLEVKNFLGKTKIRRDEKNYKESEDSVGFLMIFMHELIELIMSGEKSYDTLQHCLFIEIINEFIDEYIEALYESNSSNAYKSVAVVLNAFMEFERLYFDVRRPTPKEKIVTQDKSCEFISDEEQQRRAENRAKKAKDQFEAAVALEDETFTGKEEGGDL